MPEPTPEQLERLDAAVAALPDDLDPEKTDALVAGAFAWADATPVKRPRPKVAFVAGLVLGASLAAGGSAVLRHRPIIQREAVVDVDTGPASSAVVRLETRTLFVPRNSTVHGEWLQKGAALLEGDGVVLKAGKATIVAHGRVLVSLEPADQPSRVMPPEETMRKEWMLLGPAVAGAAAAYTAVVFVTEGTASVSLANAPPVTVNAGETWNARDQKVLPAVVVAAGVPADRPGDPSRELLAQLEALRDEKKQLLRENAALSKALYERETSVERGSSGKTGDRNYFVLTPEELKASAAKGELRLRIPLGDAPQLKVEDKPAAAIGMTVYERQAIDALYAAQKQRLLAGLRPLYTEIGGSEQVAYELSDESLLREIRTQSLKGQFADAIRQLANERAGLVPRLPPTEGSAVLRAFRVALDEDERFVADVTALLGPQRAEAFLNHPDTSHADNAFGVGPAKQ